MCVPNEAEIQVGCLDYACFGGWTGFAAPLYWVEELAATQDEGPRVTGALIVEVLRAALRERAAKNHPEEKGVGSIRFILRRKGWGAAGQLGGFFILKRKGWRALSSTIRIESE